MKSFCKHISSTSGAFTGRPYYSVKYGSGLKSAGIDIGLAAGPVNPERLSIVDKATSGSAVSLSASASIQSEVAGRLDYSPMNKAVAGQNTASPLCKATAVTHNLPKIPMSAEGDIAWNGDASFWQIEGQGLEPLTPYFILTGAAANAERLNGAWRALFRRSRYFMKSGLFRTTTIRTALALESGNPCSGRGIIANPAVLSFDIFHHNICRRSSLGSGFGPLGRKGRSLRFGRDSCTPVRFLLSEKNGGTTYTCPA